MSDMKLFGERVKELRTAAGLTQRQFAADLGVSVATVTSYEKAQKTPSLDTALKIAEFFNTSLDWLCGKDTGTRHIKNHGDIARFLHKILAARYLSLDVEEDYDSLLTYCEDDGEKKKSYYAVFRPNGFHSLNLRAQTPLDIFFVNYKKMFDLLESEALSQDIFDAWVESELSKLDNRHLETGDIYVDKT